MSKQFVRSAKNAIKGYSSAQVIVRDATSNDMRATDIGMLEEIASRTYDSVDFFEIMEMLDKRLNDKGKYWKHVVKSLTVLDYLVRFGSENCVLWCKENMYIIKTLKEFRYDDDSGIDQGRIIRVKAKDLTDLLMDDERLADERRFSQRRNNGRTNRHGEADDRFRERNRNRNNSNSNLGNNDVDNDLTKAIEESKKTAEEDETRRKQLAQYDDEDPEFQAALQLSKEEEELKKLQDLQRLQQQQYQLQQAQPTGTMMSNTYFDIFGNPISADEYNEYQQQQQSWEQQQEQQRIAQEQYLAQQHAQQQQLAQEQYLAQQQQQQLAQQQEQAALTNQQTAMYQQPMPTGSNNPFALDNVSNPQNNLPVQQAFNNVPESSNNQQIVQQQIPQQAQSQPEVQTQAQLQPLKQTRTGNEGITQKYNELNAMLANGTGIDTFGNIGEQRIPAQHTQTGTFINSQGTGYHQVANEPKKNPFLSSQYTGLPSSGIVPLQTGYGFGNQGPTDHQPPQLQQQSQGQPQQQQQSMQYAQHNQPQQTQNIYPQPPEFRTPNQYQYQQQQHQQKNNPAPDQGISLIDL